MAPSPGTAGVLLLVVVACHPSGDLESHPAVGTPSTSVGPMDSSADVPMATRSPPAAPSAEQDAAACAARCDEVVRSRHDACGWHGGPVPSWCADSNRRMLTDCKLQCGVLE